MYRYQLQAGQLVPMLQQLTVNLNSQENLAKGIDGGVALLKRYWCFC